MSTDGRFTTRRFRPIADVLRPGKRPFETGEVDESETSELYAIKAPDVFVTLSRSDRGTFESAHPVMFGGLVTAGGERFKVRFLAIALVTGVVMRQHGVTMIQGRGTMRQFGGWLAVAALIFGAITPSRAVAADEPIVVVVRFFPSAGREDEVQARLAQLAKFVPAVNAGVVFQLHRSTKAPTTFLMYEAFPSQVAVENQLKTVLPAFTK